MGIRGGRRSRVGGCELHGDRLVVRNIVGRFVHATTVVGFFQSLRDAFDRWCTINYNANGPVLVILLDACEVG